MCMEMDGNTHFLFENTHEFSCRTWLADSCHVLDTQDVGPCLFQLLGEIDVVLQVVLTALGIEQIPGLAQRPFAQGAGFDHSIHGHTHVVYPVQGVKDTEYIDAVFGCLLYKIANHVVRVVGVSNSI